MSLLNQKERKWVLEIQADGPESERALEEVYLHYREDCAKFLRSKNASLEQIKNIYQETMLSIHEKKLKGFRQDASLRQYIISICRNLFHDELRKNKRFAIKDLTEAEKLEYPDSIEQFVEWEDIKRVLEPILASMGSECQKIISLRIDGWELKELASIEGMKHQSMKNKVGRCKNRIKQFLGGDKIARIILKNLLT